MNGRNASAQRAAQPRALEANIDYWSLKGEQTGNPAVGWNDPVSIRVSSDAASMLDALTDMRGSRTQVTDGEGNALAPEVQKKFIELQLRSEGYETIFLDSSFDCPVELLGRGLAVAARVSEDGSFDLESARVFRIDGQGTTSKVTEFQHEDSEGVIEFLRSQRPTERTTPQEGRDNRPVGWDEQM